MTENYIRIEERALSEIIDRKRNYYQAQIADAFNVVYRSKNITRIEQFEQAISAISRAAIEGKLEVIVRKETGKKKRVNRKPILTYELYKKARNKRVTNEEIKEDFRADNPRQIAGFIGAYNRYVKGKKGK